MKVKEIQRTANIAWSPAQLHPIHVAAGTAAQQLDASFSTAAAVEIYTMNLSDSSQDVTLCGSLESDVRFHKLIWSPHGLGEDHQHGILAGGADAGKFFIWSPERIMNNAEGALLFSSEKHVGPVQAMDFNPFQVNLIASGASDSEIYIWDFNKPDNPMTPGTKSQPSDDVSCVAWNKQVQHIMASTFNTRCVVWDLRKSEPIIKITESMSQIKSKLVCWHPEIATQMVLTSEDDHIPVIQLWDLRFATSPLKVLENHQRGVLSCSWCQEDPELLLSCGKDNRILCWSATSPAPTGEVIFELPTSNQWSYDVQWCPRNPCIISSCAFDGHISIFNILGGEPAESVSSKVVESFPQQAPLSPTDFFAQANVQQYQHQQQQQQMCRIPLQKPPKWLRRPVGARFGFGGKLVTFQPSEQTDPRRLVTVSQVCIENQLLVQSQRFQQALLSQDHLINYCEEKTTTEDQNDKLNVWRFLRTKFEDEPRQKFLQLLGHDGQNLGEKVAKLVKEEDGELVNGVGELDLEEEHKKDEDAFEMIADTSKHTLASDGKPVRIDTDDVTIDGLLNQAILTGRLEDGVRLCVHSQRWSEALILAAAGGAELLAKTQRRYLVATDQSRQLIACLVTGQFDQLVKSCDLESWKQVLSVILTYAPAETFAKLCDALGQRLEHCDQAHLTVYAPLCYICSGSIERVIRIWASSDHSGKTGTRPDQLQELIERVMVLRQAAAGTDGDLSVLANTMYEYADLLASQGSLHTAVQYLQHCSSTSPATQMLSDRLYTAMGQKQQQQYAATRVQDRRAAVVRHGSGSTTAQHYQPNTYTPAPSTRLQPVQPAPSSNTSGQYYQPVPVQPPQPTGGVYQPGSQPPVYSPANYQTGVVNSQPGMPPAPSAAQFSSSNASNATPSYQAGAPAYHPGGTAPSSYQFAKPTRAWNDPPPVVGGHKKPAGAAKTTPTQAITTPLYNPAQASYPEQTPPGAPGHHHPHQQQHQHPSYFQQGGYPSSAAASNRATPPPQPIPPAQMYQPAPAPSQQPLEKPRPQAPPSPVVKAPIPAQHEVLHSTLNSLAQHCSSSPASQNPHMKRKLDDVIRKLENLYDRLRGNALSESALQGLHQICQYIQMGDYDSALHVHTMMISQGNFTEISSFMPGVKVLVQIASQQGVRVA